MKNNRRFIILAICLMVLVAGALWAKAQYVVPVIMYHKVDGNSATSRLSVSPESFEKQMRFLKNQRYNVVKLEDLADIIRKNKIPPKTIAITFDDGYESNYTNAFPVLKKVGLHATIFIIPALVGTEGYLNWNQIIEMSESGFVGIGSHTMTHPWLPTQPVQKLDPEIRDSKIAIENRLNKEAAAFSYPLGGFNKDVREKVAQAGYKIAVATNPGKKYPKHDIFAMKRLRISSTSDNLFVFWFEITGFYTWIKEHRDKD